MEAFRHSKLDPPESGGGQVTASSLATALEGRREGHEWRCRCPVHGGRSLSITEKDGKLLLVCRAGCHQGEVIVALKKMALWGIVSSYDTSLPPELNPSEQEVRADRASTMWEQTHLITPGDPIYRYLTGRGIVLDDWPEDLHYHPALPYWTADDTGKPVKTGTFPAMLALVRSPQGRPVSLHRTYLTNDGRKCPVDSPKKIFKVHDLTGSAVRLFPPRSGFLAVCEGIEDALSAWKLWKIPTWATLGTSGLKGFIPPEGIRELLIFADRDENQAGQKAAWFLAKRLKRKMAVRIRVPSGHEDLNALLTERITHAISIYHSRARNGRADHPICPGLHY